MITLLENSNVEKYFNCLVDLWDESNNVPCKFIYSCIQEEFTPDEIRYFLTKYRNYSEEDADDLIASCLKQYYDESFSNIRENKLNEESQRNDYSVAAFGDISCLSQMKDLAKRLSSTISRVTDKIKAKDSSGVFDFPDDLDDEDFETETVDGYVSGQIREAWDKMVEAENILYDLYFYTSKL